MIKKLIPLWVVITIFLTGCAAISKQINTMELMKNYTFNMSANKVFAKAEDYYRNQNLTLTGKFKNTGVTPWKQVLVSGPVTRTNKIRFRVTVSQVGKNRTSLRVVKESVPLNYNKNVLGASLIKADSIRYIPAEFDILQYIDPQEAKRLETKAAKM